MSTMIDRVADAIGREARLLTGENILGGCAVEIARAAITAMREPTLAMKRDDTARDAIYSHETSITRCERVWRAMIDAALAEKP